MRRRILVLGIVGLAMAGAASEAKGIKVKMPRGLPGRPKYGPDVLRPEELEQCLRVEKEINLGADALDSLDRSLEARSAAIEQLGRDLDQSAQRLDRTSQPAIDAHNAKVNQYNQLAQERQTQIATFNKQVSDQNAKVDQFNSGCANKKYYESDMKAAREKVGS